MSVRNGDEKKMILLVEDNPDHQTLAERALRKNNISNVVVIAQDGEEALQFFAGTGKFEGRDTDVFPAVVLLDLKLPKVDGLEVLRRLRADPKTQLLPIVVLTSSDEEKDVVESYKLGANSYIRKPVDFGQFTEATRQLGLYWLVLNQGTRDALVTKAG